jgi:hypothetical protein
MSESAPYCIACFEAFVDDVIPALEDSDRAALLGRWRPSGTAAA